MPKSTKSSSSPERRRALRPAPIVHPALLGPEPPVHPGELLEKEFVRPTGISQLALGRQLGMARTRLNELLNCRRGITPSMALRLGQVFGTGAEVWLALQRDWDLWHLLRTPQGARIRRLKPLVLKD